MQNTHNFDIILHNKIRFIPNIYCRFHVFIQYRNKDLLLKIVRIDISCCYEKR